MGNNTRANGTFIAKQMMMLNTLNLKSLFVITPVVTRLSKCSYHLYLYHKKTRLWYNIEPLFLWWYRRWQPTDKSPIQAARLIRNMQSYQAMSTFYQSIKQFSSVRNKGNSCSFSITLSCQPVKRIFQCLPQARMRWDSIQKRSLRIFFYIRVLTRNHGHTSVSNDPIPDIWKIWKISWYSNSVDELQHNHLNHNDWPIAP